MKKLNLAVMALLLQAGLASAHARWKVDSLITPPRSIDTGLKTSPCGGIPRTATFSQFKPGAAVTVEFEETIQHISYFIISFSPAGEAEASFTANVLAPNIVDDNTVTPHTFKATITMPNVKCTDCTLQLIQVMKDGAGGLAGPETGRYYSCSDIQLVDVPQPRTPPAPPAAKPDTAAPGVPKNLKLELKK